MRGLCAAVLAAVALLATGAAAFAKPRPPLEKTLLAAIDRAHVGADSGTALRTAVMRTISLAPRVPPLRERVLRAQIAQVAELAPHLTTPEAVTLAGQLNANDDWFASKRAPGDKTDITDADGIVYRYFSGRGFEFHPLANFAALNADVAAKSADSTAKLAAALAARGSVSGPGIGWQYLFDYAGGHAPWLSGMAQAVAAQSLARASQLLGDAQLMDEARGAYHAIPGRLVQATSAGLWVKLYSFDHEVVLNAQLQTILSLQTYAGAAEDSGAAALATRLQNAAAASLGRFDTGYWSYYELPDVPSPLDYQDYVVQLLQRLAKADQRFADAAQRFATYRTVPPQFKLGDGGAGAVDFWVSKPSSVTVTALGGARHLYVTGGWHTVAWPLPKQAGVWQVHVEARDWAGNGAAIEALPIVKVVAPPKPKPKPKHKATVRDVASGFVVGAGIDSPSQAALAKSTGLGAVRLSLAWPAGATAPDPATLASLRSVPSSQRIALELVADPIPTDPGSLSALASYAATLASSLPNVRDLLLGPPPTVATASAYAAALSAVASSVHAALVPPPAVAAEVDGAQSPKPTLAALTAAHATFDEIAYRPVAGVPAPATTTPMLIDLVADPTTVPADKQSLYQQPLAATGDSEAGQATAYADEIAADACRPGVAGVLFRRLVDSPSPGEQAGLYYLDGTPKASVAAVKAALATLAAGTTCGTPSPAPAPAPAPSPTPTPPAGPLNSTVTFPSSLERGTPPSVQVSCSKDCLYLVTLERTSDGKPVLATRGSLHAAATVHLPDVPFPAGSYRLRVRLVAQASPGPLTTQTSGIITAS